MRDGQIDSGGRETNAPPALLRDLGLFEKIASGPPKLDRAVLEQFERRTRSFDWVHLGTTGLEFDRLLAALRSASWLSPVRSGHIGNWTDIAAGRAGALDYNRVVCRQLGVARPLVYDLNQTEGERPEAGDWIYLPASLVDRGERRRLELYTWNGVEFERRSGEQPLLTPLVMTPVDGEFAPLSSLHRGRMESLQEWRFSFEANVFLANEELVRKLLERLVQAARRHPKPDRALGDLFDRGALLDGTVLRSPARFGSGCIRVGDASFGSISELLDAAMLPFSAAARPREFFDAIAEHPQPLPLLSVACVHVLYGLLDTHVARRSSGPRTVNTHVHWGAVGMAGYPPWAHGYFRKRVRVARDICDVIVGSFEEIDPLLFVLIPVAPLLLWPSDAFPDDLALVEELITSARRATDGAREPQSTAAAMERVASEWWAGTAAGLSSYFADRFRLRRSVWTGGAVPDASDALEPGGFGGLTLRQACALVGALMRVGGAERRREPDRSANR
jgi:hypothetical protein